MQKLIFVVYDRAANFYSDPIFAQSKGEAVRSFLDIHGSDHVWAKHPEDYTLFEVGSFDTATATFKTVAPTKVIGLWEAIPETEAKSEVS